MRRFLDGEREMDGDMGLRDGCDIFHIFLLSDEFGGLGVRAEAILEVGVRQSILNTLPSTTPKPLYCVLVRAGLA